MAWKRRFVSRAYKSKNWKRSVRIYRGPKTTRSHGNVMPQLPSETLKGILEKEIWQLNSIIRLSSSGNLKQSSIVSKANGTHSQHARRVILSCTTGIPPGSILTPQVAKGKQSRVEAAIAKVERALFPLR